MKNVIIHCLSLFFIGFIFFSCNRFQQPDYNHRISYFKNISTQTPNDSVLRCVTFNIKMGFGIGDPWDKDQRGADMESIKKIARLIRQVDANIVALQEVAHNRYNADIKYYLETLATELNMNYAFGAHGYNDPYEIIPVEGHWGNAILSTFPIKNIHNQEVEYRSVWERRSMIDAQLHINDSTVIHALSLHYLPTQEGIDRTAAYLPQLGDPYILMGDFNYIGPIAEFEPLGVSDVDSIGFTHIIDRIFVDKSIFTVDEIGAAIDTMQTSDHPANFAVLRLK